MSSTRTNGDPSGGGGDASVTDRSEAEARKRDGSHPARGALRLPDFDNPKFQPRWSEIIDRERKALAPDILEITEPRTKLDPIAEEARAVLCAVLIRKDEGGKDAESLEKILKEVLGTRAGRTKYLKEAEALEKDLRDRVISKGLASEVKKVTDRLNAQRMSEGRRWVLSATYAYLLAKSFKGASDRELEELVKDDLGLADKVMLNLDAKGGALETFAYLIVDAVIKRNFMQDSVTLKRVVSQQLRGAI